VGWGCVRVARCLAFETGPNKYHPSLVCLVFFLLSWVVSGIHDFLPAIIARQTLLRLWLKTD